MIVMNTIAVVNYDSSWPILFQQLRDRIVNAIAGTAVVVEHVGSTAVAALPAKPVIGMSVVVTNSQEAATAIERLESLGYKHPGNLGIEGREAFDNPPHWPDRHLYLCQQGNLALRNRLAIRDYLRLHPQIAKAYAELKQQLARDCANAIDRYNEVKIASMVR